MVYASYTRSTRQIPRLASLVPRGSIRSGRVDPRYVQCLSEEQHLHLARGEDSEHRGAGKAAPACNRARHFLNQHTGTMPIPTSASCANSSILRISAPNRISGCEAFLVIVSTEYTCSQIDFPTAPSAANFVHRKHLGSSSERHVQDDGSQITFGVGRESSAAD